MKSIPVEVVKTKNNSFYLEWDLLFTHKESGVVDDYKFQIYYSMSPQDGYIPVQDESDDPIEIDGATGPLVYEHPFKEHDFNQVRYYKILAINKDDSSITQFSEKAFIDMETTGVHETMMYAEGVLADIYIGEPGLIIKKKTFGARCTNCWSEERQQRTLSKCPVCFDSGYLNGYYQPIQVQLMSDSTPKKSDLQKDWENVGNTKRMRMTNYPLVRPKDIIITTDDFRRYVVIHVETTKIPNFAQSATILARRNYILSQFLTLEEINTDDMEYVLDIDNIGSIPDSDDMESGSLT